MASIKEFRDYLHTEGLRSLYETEANLKRLSSSKRWEDLKFISGQGLNTLYFEMLDFITWLEQEQKEIRSKTVKEFLNILRKDSEMVLDVRQEVLSTGSSFRNDELFRLALQRLLGLLHKVIKTVEKYEEDLLVLEQELLDTSVILKRVDDYILQTPEMIGKIRQKINKATYVDFPSQRVEIAAPLQYLSEQIEEQYQRLNTLKKVPALRRVLATVQLTKNSLADLAKTVSKTDPKIWKQSAASFEVFRDHLLKDLQGVQNYFRVIADDLQDVQKQLAA